MKRRGALDNDDVEAGLEAYGLSSMPRTPLHGGLINQVWRVDSPDGPFVLKRYKSRDLVQLQLGLEVQARARAGGIPVPAVYPNLEGSLFTLVKGRPFVLSEFAAGEAYPPDAIPPQPAHKMGEVLGHLHLSLRSMPPGRPPAALDKGALEVILRLLLKKANERRSNPVDACAAQNLEAKLSLVSQLGDPPPMVGQWTHGDYEWCNVLFDPAGAVTSVIDFDNAKYAHRGHDVVRCIRLSFPSLGPEVDEFFAGYVEVSGTTPEEAQSYVKYYRYVSSTGYWPLSERYLRPQTYQSRWDSLIQPHRNWDWDGLSERLATIAASSARARTG